MAKTKVITRPKGLTLPLTTTAEHAAIKAISMGTATPEQQQRFYEWVIKKAGMIGGLSFDPDNSSMTHFNEGRRYVAAAVIHFTTEPIGVIHD